MFAAILLGLHRGSSRWQEDWVSLLADILGVALAGAVAFTIFSEVLGKMVLLIPKAVQKIRDAGRAEGKSEGQAEERKAQSVRYKEASKRIVVGADGKRILEITPEIEELLSGQSEE